MTTRTYPDLETYFAETGNRQFELAERVGISGSYMSRIVNKLQQPRLQLALKIVREVPVPLESLISSESERA